MVGTAHGAGIVAASAFLLPALGFALGPVFEEQKPSWHDVGPVDEFPEDTYIAKVITTATGIGEVGKTTAYIRRRNMSIDTEKADQYNQFVAISTRCMHLGCPVRFVAAAERFI